MNNTSVQGCWASSLGDCKGKLSREHTVSECLFSSGLVTVQGFYWCKDEPKTVGSKSLTRKILCEYHNNALSELDSAMLRYFEVIRETARLNDLRTRLKASSWTIKRYELDGALLERWFLKTLINLNFEGRWRIGDDGDIEGHPPKELVEIAFGRKTFKQHAGMYIAVRAGEMITMRDGVTIQSYSDGDRLVVFEFTTCGYRFILSLVPEEVKNFAGSQLLNKETNIWFRVPDQRLRMVRSHLIHIKR